MTAHARMLGFFGGGEASSPTVAAAATLYVPDSASYVKLTGSATVTALQATPSSRDRLVIFEQTDSGSTVFTNTNDTTTTDLMDLGGSNITLGQTDILVLRLRPDGSWVRIVNTNN